MTHSKFCYNFKLVQRSLQGKEVKKSMRDSLTTYAGKVATMVKSIKSNLSISKGKTNNVKAR